MRRFCQKSTAPIPFQPWKVNQVTFTMRLVGTLLLHVAFAQAFTPFTPRTASPKNWRVLHSIFEEGGMDSTSSTTEDTTNSGRGSELLPMEAHYLTFPRLRMWKWQKASPKLSLYTVNPTQNNPAPAWLLNLVEFGHWVNMPIAFFVAYVIFQNTNSLAVGLDGDSSRVFWILLSVLMGQFSTAGAIIMHSYEDWQLAPFRNPLALPKTGVTNDDLDSVRVENFNNAWLSAVFMDVLFTFNNISFSLFTLGVFGFNVWTQLLVILSIAVTLLGPKEPILKLTRIIPTDGTGTPRPIMRLPVSQIVLFAITVVAYEFASYHLFFDALLGDGVGTWAFFVAAVRSILPAVLYGIGGIVEAAFAEAYFSQWQHLLAVAFIASGTLALGDAVQTLAAFNVI